MNFDVPTTCPWLQDGRNLTLLLSVVRLVVLGLFVCFCFLFICFYLNNAIKATNNHFVYTKEHDACLSIIYILETKYVYKIVCIAQITENLASRKQCYCCFRSVTRPCSLVSTEVGSEDEGNCPGQLLSR